MKLRPVIGLDIDGTLGAYHSHFIKFANKWLGTETNPWKYDARLPLNKYLGVSKERYRKIKLAYRRGEMKRSMPTLDAPYPDARALTKRLRGWGLDIWLCTTRPYLSHDVVDDSTRHWLRRNGVVHQGVIWGEHKYRDLQKVVGKERVVCVIDDLPEMCAQACSLGIPTSIALRDHNDNQYRALPMVEQLAYWPTATEAETLDFVKTQLQKWRSNT